MRKQAISLLKDYEKQIKAGIDPVFIPSQCGIEGIKIWDEIVQEHYTQEKEIYQEIFKENL